MSAEKAHERRVIGGVDTHKDLHVAAVVDDRDRVLATASFAATRSRPSMRWTFGVEFAWPSVRRPAVEG